MQNTIKQRFDLQYTAHIMNTTYRHTKQVTRMLARCSQGVAKVYPRCSQALGRLMSMLRVCLEYAYTYRTGGQTPCAIARHIIASHTCFSRGNTPYLLEKHCVSPRETLRSSVYLSCKQTLLTLLLLISGVVGSWGQDYSGTYYIKSGSANKQTDGDYYICPTEGWIYYKATNSFAEADNGQPFLTTHHKASEEEAKYKWVLEKHTVDEHDYYSFRYVTDYNNNQKRYLSFSGKIGNAGQDRIRLHLEIKDTPGDNELFEFLPYYTSPYLVIKPKLNDIVDDKEVTKYLVVNGGNKDSYKGESGKDGGPSNTYKNTAGIIGIYNDIKDPNAPFSLEEIIDRPTFASTNKDKIVINHDAGENATIYYTTDGTNPTTTNKQGSGTAPLQIEDMPADAVTLKAIAVIDNLPSCITEIRVVPNATIILGSSSFTYNGSAQEPTITVKDGETPIANSEYTVTYSDNTNAGDDATVTINNATGGGYIVYGSKTFTINKKALTIIADSETKVYDGTALTKNTYTTNTALAEGDAIESATITGSQTVVGSSDNVPSAAVIKKGDEDRTANYEITYAKGTLTVTKKALTITAEAKSKTYGEDDPALTYTSSGLVGSDAITGTLSRVAGENAGTYAINQNTLTAGDNYAIAYTGANLTINKKALTIIADAKSKTYGEDDPALTYTSSGLIGSDAITGALGREVGEDVGTYAINQNTLTAGDNYAVAYTGANLTINKKALTITADAKEKTYGDADPTLTYTQEGLVSGDAITGTLSRDTGEDVGTYAINNTLTISTNYDLTYVPANLTISQKEVGLDWTNTEFVYNGSVQAPTATATGTVNDDAIAVTVTGAQTNVGTDYTATASTLTGTKAGNYKLPTANTKKFTISPKSLGNGETAAEGITIDMTTEGDNVVLNYVKDGETTLVKDTDYTLDIQEEASDKIVEIAGIGNYTGSIKGVYVCPVFTDPDGAGAGPSAAVYQARRDFASPTGVDAYIVRSVNPTIGTLTVSKLEYIPKDVPVLLLTESQASGFLAAEKDESTQAVSVGTVNSNLLKVAPTEGVPVKTAEVYMFYLGEFVLTQAGTVKAGRFYVHNPNYTNTPNAPASAPARRSLMIVKEETTGIADLPQTENKFADDAWYTMDGRRLNGKPAKAGLYIHQGQKRVIK